MAINYDLNQDVTVTRDLIEKLGYHDKISHLSRIGQKIVWGSKRQKLEWFAIMRILIDEIEADILSRLSDEEG